MEQREGGRERCVKIQLVRQAWPDPTGPADNVSDIRFISKSHRKLVKGLWEKIMLSIIFFSQYFECSCRRSSQLRCCRRDRGQGLHHWFPLTPGPGHHGQCGQWYSGWEILILRNRCGWSPMTGVWLRQGSGRRWNLIWGGLSSSLYAQWSKMIQRVFWIHAENKSTG